MRKEYSRPLSRLLFVVVVSLIMTYPLVFHLWEAVQPQLEALVEKMEAEV